MRISVINNQSSSKRQSFSSTDLNKDVNNSPGIVFPLSQASWQVSISSIVDHHLGRVELAHNEARLCNTENNTINYYKGRCIGYVRDPKRVIQPSEVEALFDVQPQEVGEGYFITDNAEVSKFVQSVKEVWDSIDYKPNTDFIKKENLVKKTYTAVYPSFKKHYYASSLFGDTSSIQDTEAVKDTFIDDTAMFLNNYYGAKSKATPFHVEKAFNKLSAAAAKKYLLKLYKEYADMDIDPKTLPDTKLELRNEYEVVLRDLSDDTFSYGGY